VNKKGLSLVETTIAGSILAGLVVVVMKTSVMGNNIANNARANNDIIELSRQLDAILDSKRCMGSLGGLIFKGSDIFSTPMDLDLWRVNSSGGRIAIKYSTTSGDSSHSNFGNYVLDGIKLSLTTLDSATDFAEGDGNAVGEITITGRKKVNGKLASNFKTIRKEIELEFNTAGPGANQGESTITACRFMGTLGGSTPQPDVWYSANDGDTLIAGRKYLVDMQALPDGTVSSPTTISVTLPSSPQKGDQVTIFDSTGSFSDVRHLIISPSGTDLIMGQNVDLQADLPDMHLTLVFIDAASGWRFLD
jgi:hypothetical protein